MNNPFAKTLMAGCAALSITLTTGMAGQAIAQGSTLNEQAQNIYAPAQLRDRLPQDEVIYFVLPDRFNNGDNSNDTGGITGDKMAHGFDATHKGFYHGGDLYGLTQKLDYLQNLGITAIWFAPIFKNKPVQGAPGQESSGYHGYWVTDFLSVDPHFGSNDEFRAFVKAAHARGMKVYMDIITNHTADVIYFKECEGKNSCDYRSKADYPYQSQGKPGDKSINRGFAGDQVMTPENYAQLVRPDYAYTPTLPVGEENIKNPAWLNNPIYYHNRGNTTFKGESATYGDFSGLDDLMTENPTVLRGFVEIYQYWITEFGIDGYRIDTARHVNPEFWQGFVPQILATAKAEGIPNFHIFGEVYNDSVDPGYLAHYSRKDGFPALLDFSFQSAARQLSAGTSGTDIYEKLLHGDVLYEGGEKAALQLPTFLGNHDMGRIGHLLMKDAKGDDAKSLLKRDMLAHVLMFTSRGVPTIYYGDEQGFTGDGHDQDAREDMFPSQVDIYNDNILLGSKANTGADNFDSNHVLYRHIRALSDMRRNLPALRHGKTTLRYAGETPGLLAYSRGDDNGEEVLVVMNTSDKPIKANVEIGYRSRSFIPQMGSNCPKTIKTPGSAVFELPAFGYAICASTPID